MPPPRIKNRKDNFYRYIIPHSPHELAGKKQEKTREIDFTEKIINGKKAAGPADAASTASTAERANSNPFFRARQQQVQNVQEEKNSDL